ncbi:alpha/beta hydrolase [Kitasatospora sp. NPDC028055]|uniref:alpha/beta fold hydrolase n=1 Tax=Kitasatospora sp. NPDC028055 TaxID=3155653 RepID=UPI0033FE7236
MRTEHEVPTPDGGRLWAERSGTGSPVVLLHGSGMDSRLWDAVTPTLARHHDVIRYDARGLGRSAPPQQPFDDLADLRTVLDHFDLARPALVGLSMGAETALDFTLAHPDRVASLTLIGASVSGHHWPPTPDTTAYAEARRRGDAATLAALELSVWAALGRTAPGGDLIETMVTENAARRITSEHHLTGAPPRDAESHLTRITTPTLIIHGTHDHPEIATIAARLATDIPHAHHHLLPAADHYLPLRTPTPLTTLLLPHLA